MVPPQKDALYFSFFSLPLLFSMVPPQKDALYFSFFSLPLLFPYGTLNNYIYIYIDMYIIEEEALQYSLELETLQTTHT